MMKKLTALLLLCVCLVMPLAPVFAAESSVPEVREVLEDGDFIVTVIEDGAAGIQNEDTLSTFGRLLELLKRLIRLFTGTKTVEKTKYVNYYDKNGALLWTVQMEAVFSYSKNKATCDKARITSVFYDSDWKLISSSTSKDGNTATGRFTVRQTKLGVPLKTVERTVTLTCDTNGTVF